MGIENEMLDLALRYLFGTDVNSYRTIMRGLL